MANYHSREIQTLIHRVHFSQVRDRVEKAVQNLRRDFKNMEEYPQAIAMALCVLLALQANNDTARDTPDEIKIPRYKQITNESYTRFLEALLESVGDAPEPIDQRETEKMRSMDPLPPDTGPSQIVKLPEDISPVPPFSWELGQFLSQYFIILAPKGFRPSFEEMWEGINVELFQLVVACLLWEEQV